MVGLKMLKFEKRRLKQEQELIQENIYKRVPKSKVWVNAALIPYTVKVEAAEGDVIPGLSGGGGGGGSFFCGGGGGGLPPPLVTGGGGVSHDGGGGFGSSLQVQEQV